MRNVERLELLRQPTEVLIRYDAQKAEGGRIVMVMEPKTINVDQEPSELGQLTWPRKQKMLKKSSYLFN